MRTAVGVVKAAKKGAGPHYFLLINAGQLLFQRLLVDPKVIVKPGLRSPAKVESGVVIGLGPLHQLAELAPVVDLLERQLFNQPGRQ